MIGNSYIEKLNHTLKSNSDYSPFCFIDKTFVPWNTLLMTSSERISWIDVARGIGILSVLYAHGLDGNSIRYFFYAFHIPLFFFLSGIVFHHRNHENVMVTIKKALKGILIPYFMFALLSYSVWLLFADPSRLSMAMVAHHFVGILYGNGSTSALFFNVVLWFLPCLFGTRLIFSFLTDITNKKRFLLSALFIFSLLGYGISIYFPDLALPFGFETVLTGTVFFGAGYLFNRYSHHHRVILQKYSLLIFVISLLVCILLATFHYGQMGEQIDMRLNRLGNYGLFYLTAFAGILSFVALSIFIQKNRVLEHLGKNSMYLFVWHLIVFSLISKVLMLIIAPETISQLRNFYLAPAYSLVSIFIILSATKLYKKVSQSVR